MSLLCCYVNYQCDLTGKRNLMTANNYWWWNLKHRWCYCNRFNELLVVGNDVVDVSLIVGYYYACIEGVKNALKLYETVNIYFVKQIKCELLFYYIFICCEFIFCIWLFVIDGWKDCFGRNWRKDGWTSSACKDLVIILLLWVGCSYW